MADPKIEQVLSVAAGTTGDPWKLDLVLPVPVLVGPKNGDTICPHPGIGLSGIVLRWLPVMGATGYIVQWCLNGSFHGPTMRSVLVSTLYYEMVSLVDVRQTEEVHWRVAAVNGAGGSSDMSEARTFKFECPEGQNPGDGSGNSGTPSGSGQDLKCGDYNITMQLVGPEIAMCCDTITFRLRTAWNCKDAFDRPMVVRDPSFMLWEMRQNDGCEFLSRRLNGCIIKLACRKTQLVTLIARAQFIDLRGGVFQCVAHKRFYVDCEAGLPSRRPWMYSMYTSSRSLHPRQVGPSAAPEEGMLDVSGTTASVTNIGKSGGHKHAILVGPVVRIEDMTEIVKSAAEFEDDLEPDGSRNCKESGTFAAKTFEDVHEARVHLAVGPGLDVIDGVLVATGDGGYGYSISYGTFYAIGCGLEVVGGNTLRVDTDALAGAGLEPGAGCTINVVAGCGLYVTEENEVAVKPASSETSRWWAPDPTTMTLALVGDRFQFSMAFQEKYFLKNDCGVVMGDVQSGAWHTYYAFMSTYVCPE